VRSAKHVFRGYIQNVGAANLGAALAHFLNCFVGSVVNPQPAVSPDDINALRRNKSKKRKGQCAAANGTVPLNDFNFDLLFL
jgi:protein TIF31